MLNSFIANVVEAPLSYGAGFFLGIILLFIIIMAVVVCLITLKGYSLWTAARRGDQGWFIALLIVNTFGILELCYLYFVVEKWKKPSAPQSVPSQQ